MKNRHSLLGGSSSDSRDGGEKSVHFKTEILDLWLSNLFLWIRHSYNERFARLNSTGTGHWNLTGTKGWFNNNGVPFRYPNRAGHWIMSGKMTDGLRRGGAVADLVFFKKQSVENATHLQDTSLHLNRWERSKDPSPFGTPLSFLLHCPGGKALRSWETPWWFAKKWSSQKFWRFDETSRARNLVRTVETKGQPLEDGLRCHSSVRRLITLLYSILKAVTESLLLIIFIRPDDALNLWTRPLDKTTLVTRFFQVRPK